MGGAGSPLKGPYPEACWHCTKACQPPTMPEPVSEPQERWKGGHMRFYTEGGEGWMGGLLALKEGVGVAVLGFCLSIRGFWTHLSPCLWQCWVLGTGKGQLTGLGPA